MEKIYLVKCTSKIIWEECKELENEFIETRGRTKTIAAYYDKERAIQCREKWAEDEKDDYIYYIQQLLIH